MSTPEASQLGGMILAEFIRDGAVLSRMEVTKRLREDRQAVTRWLEAFAVCGVLESVGTYNYQLGKLPRCAKEIAVHKARGVEIGPRMEVSS